MRVLVIALCLSLPTFIFSQTISRVRLKDHTSYIIDLLQQTLSRAQRHNFVNLKVQDVTLDVEEEVLNNTVKGTVTFKDGFVVSMQHARLIPHTVQQVWLNPRGTNTTVLELRSTLRFENIVLGYNILGEINNEGYHNTGTILYPQIEFQTALIKNLYTDELTSRVVHVLFSTSNKMKFFPEDEYSQILSNLFGWNSTYLSVERWAADVFAPTILELAQTELPIPEFCYDCPVR